MSAEKSQSRPRTTKEWAQDALVANKRLHEELSARVARLEAEIQEADRLLNLVKSEDGDEDEEPEVWVPGGKKASGLCSPADFLNPAFPFYEAAKKRSTYLTNTSPRPMKPREVEILASAVRLENERLQAYKTLNPAFANSGPVDLVNNVEHIDWQRVAERVSDATSTPRTAIECEVSWVGYHHPRINHGEWKKPEIDKLNELIRSVGNNTIDWVDIANKLETNRTPIDCLRHGITRTRFKWTPDMDDVLCAAVEEYGIDNWALVARRVSENATGLQCQSRWYKSVDPALKRGAWSSEEDERLRRAVAGYGASWVHVATAVPGRTNDQCRERWLEHLSRTPQDLIWTEEEDKILLQGVEELGKQWKIICVRVGNRKTGPMCRARYDKLKKLDKVNQNSIRGPQTSGSLSCSASATPASTAGFSPVAAPSPLPTPTPPPIARVNSLSAIQTTSQTGAVQAPTGTSVEDVNQTPKPKPRPRPRPVTLQERVDGPKADAMARSAPANTTTSAQKRPEPPSSSDAPMTRAKKAKLDQQMRKR